MTEQQLRHECAKLAAEWNIAGFVNGAIYEDFAVELAKRAAAIERNGKKIVAQPLVRPETMG